jgi:hypothetical protein
MITAVTTCMGRRSFLEVTLPYMMSEFDEVRVVDWSCPDDAASYALSVGARVICKRGEQYFSGPKAKNYGARDAYPDYLAFIDADTLVLPGFGDKLRGLVSRDCMVVSERNSEGYDVQDLIGFIAVKADSFWNVGGFDESYIGWGQEDFNLRGKLFLEEGLKVKRIGGLGSIPHSNAEREVNRELPLEVSAKRNFEQVSKYFESQGVSDWINNPRVSEIAFKAHPDAR